MIYTRAICVTLLLCASTGLACSDVPSEEMLIEMSIEPPKPILDGYTADPHAVVFDDTYYVYPTSDKPGWQTTDFSVWSSK